MAIASTLMAAMYLLMVFSVSELCAALPHAGGFYAYTRSAFGAFAGYFCGIAVLLEYLITTAAGVYYFGDLAHGYVQAVPTFVWWAVGLVAVVLLNLQGTETMLKVTLGIAAAAIALVLLFAFGVLSTGKLDFAMFATATGQGPVGLLAALPYAMWWFLAIEAVPLISEEAKDPARDVPKAMTWGMYTLMFLAVVVLVLNTALPFGVEEGQAVTGAAALALSDQPFDDGMQLVFGTEGLGAGLALVAGLVGQLVAYPMNLYACSRVFFALSRGGYLPQWLSVTNEQRVPARATLTAAVLAMVLVVPFLLKGSGDDAVSVGDAMVTVSVAAATVTYILVMASYIRLKTARPHMPRPYRSPVGLPGAFVGTALAVLALLACFIEASYRISVLVFVGMMVLASIYYFAIAQNQLVEESPEEQFALTEEEAAG
ncbi:MAG TPA: amino acid ABC transporter permease [Cyanobacteria bacterium UBA8156]|nr:amino acid ABC transporter permease [Cyanobacteria bacterium UBA8156]